jgi:hypothetical protein
LNTWTRFLAISDRRTRRISSSLLPENITPATTSIQPPAVWNPSGTSCVLARVSSR